MALGAGVNQGIGFGMTFYLQDEFTQTASRITAGMTNLDQLSNQYANSVKGSFSRGFNDIASGMAGIAGAAAMLMPLGYGLKMAGEFESVRIQLETLLKSKDAANAFFGDLKKDALMLPLLGFKDLAKGSGYLIAAGVAAQTAREDLMNLGKSVMAVGGTRDAFNRMAYNLSQVKNQGKATGLDMRQFAQANLPIGMYLQRTSGKKINDKNITYDDLTKAFALFAKENDVAGAMMNSINGQAAMLKENFEYLFAGIGDAIAPFFVKLAKGLNSLLTSLTAFVETPVGKFVARFLSMAVVFASVATAVFYANKAFGGFKRIIATLLFDVTSLMSVTRPMIYSFLKMAALFWAMTTLIHSNSGALVGLGFAMSMFMGKMGFMTAVFMLFARAYSAWNDFASGKNKNLTGLSGFFIKFGAILQGVLEIMNGLNKEGWIWSSEFDGKLRDSGMYDTVVMIGTVIHGLYRMLSYLYNFINTDTGQVVAAIIGVIFVFMKLSLWVTNIGKGIGTLGKALVWLRGLSWAAAAPYILWIGLFITLIYLVYKISDAFRNWHKWTTKEKFVGLISIFIAIAGAITLAYYAVGTLSTGFLALAATEALALAPFLAIAGAIALIITYWDRLVEKMSSFGGLQYLISPTSMFSDMGTWLGQDLRKKWDSGGSDTGFTPSQYLEQNGGDMRELKSSMYSNPFNTSSSQSGDGSYQPVDQTIILQLDGYELHRQLISHGDFNTARS